MPVRDAGAPGTAETHRQRRAAVQSCVESARYGKDCMPGCRAAARAQHIEGRCGMRASKPHGGIYLACMSGISGTFVIPSGSAPGAAAAEIEQDGGVAMAIEVDVADHDAVEQAAARVEAELGPIDVWINCAMATIFCRVDQIAPRDLVRATHVTYLGAVWGTLAAVGRMKARDRGVIVQVGSALAYRSIPLQAPYCGAKSAPRAPAPSGGSTPTAAGWRRWYSSRSHWPWRPGSRGAGSRALAGRSAEANRCSRRRHTGERRCSAIPNSGNASGRP